MEVRSVSKSALDQETLGSFPSSPQTMNLAFYVDTGCTPTFMDVNTVGCSG